MKSEARTPEEIAKEIIECRFCDGQEWTAEHCQHDGEKCLDCPIQVQCQNCYSGTIEGNQELLLERITQAITAERAELAEIKESINLLTCKKVNAEDELKDVKADLASKEVEIATLIASKLVVPSHPQETFDKVLDVAKKNTILEAEILSCAETIQRMREALEGMSELCGNYFDESGLICVRDKEIWKKHLEVLALPPHASEKRVKNLQRVFEDAKKVHSGKKFGWGHAVVEEDWNQLGESLAACEEK